MGQNGKGGGRTLANDRERRAYAADPANWEPIAELSAGGAHDSLRVERLKGTPIVRVLGWVEIAWLGGSWHGLGAYEIVPDTGAMRTVYSLTAAKIAERLRALGI